MSPEILSQIHLVLGYVAWLLCFGAHIWPRLKAQSDGPHLSDARSVCRMVGSAAR
jgi:hypothetical protein